MSGSRAQHIPWLLTAPPSLQRLRRMDTQDRDGHRLSQRCGACSRQIYLREKSPW